MRPGVLAGVGGVGLVLVVVLALLGYRESYRGRIFPGVAVAGLSVGGMSPEQARAKLGGHLSASFDAPLIVEANGRQWKLSRRALGAQYDLASLADAAFAVGRTGGVLDRLVTPAVTAARHRDLDADVELGPADWTQALGPIAEAVDRPAVDARLAVSTDHVVQVVPDRSGVRLDRNQAKREIAAALVSGASAPVQLPIVLESPTVRAADLGAAQKQVSVALSGPVSVAYSGQTWTLSVDDLQLALVLPRATDNGKLSELDVDAPTLDRFVQKIASDVDRPGQSAHLALQSGKVVATPSKTARTVDRAATAAQIRAALLTTQRMLVPTVKEARPVVVESDLAPSLAAANLLVGAPIVLSGPAGQTWTLTSAMLQKMLAIPPDPTAQRDQTPRLDPAKLKEYVAGVADDVDRPAANARFQYSGGQVKLIRDGASGYQLDQQSTADLIQKAATGDSRTVALPVASVAPAFGSQDAGKLADIQLIGQNSTSYAGSIPPRRHNVELATSMLNGVVVPPGQIFSFNQELGPQTLDRGFQVGYGIVAEANGGVKTVPSVGGGICQVSTTLFQPVFWAGYEIEERHWHAYWIAHYASHGYPGLDDTVDDASHLDFQFKNTTANPILIQSSTDGTHVYFSIYGVPPTWTVHVDQPVVTDIVKTDRQLQVEADPTLAPGQRIYTEAAEDGFTVSVHRRVDDGNGNVRDLNLRSVYAPSHNVMAVGPSAGAKPAA